MLEAGSDAISIFGGMADGLLTILGRSPDCRPMRLDWPPTDLQTR